MKTQASPTLPDRVGPDTPGASTPGATPPFPPASTTACPACGAPLDRRTTAGPGVSGVTVEVCDRCLGLWVPPYSVRQIADPRASDALAGAFGRGVRFILRAIETQIYTDHLTRVRNRRAFDLALETAVREAKETGRRFSLLFVDLDGFKALNDTHGHARADEALRAFAQVLRSRFRPMDHVARYGGDEFAVVLPDADRRAARDAAMRLARHLRRARIHGETAVEASIGTATYPDDGTTPEEIVRAADGEMYREKRSKQNGHHGCGRAVPGGTPGAAPPIGVLHVTEPPEGRPPDDDGLLVPSGTAANEDPTAASDPDRAPASAPTAGENRL